MAKDEKLKALDLALSQIEKDFGKEAIMRLGEKHAAAKVEVIPTGALPLDIAIGAGGIPRGRIIEIYGPESSGKNHSCFMHGFRNAENRRNHHIYRRRACHGSGICREIGSGHRQSSYFPAGFRRTGVGNSR